jgi:site-specific DNA-methyltransferase (adenine-specific)
MARKPPEGSLTDNVLKWGVGGLNIDKCRVGQRERPQFTGRKRKSTFGGEVSYDYDKITQNKELNVSMYEKSTKPLPDQRYPSNFILDGFGAELLDSVTKQASRFFYVPKASKEERELGLEGMELKVIADKGNGLGRTCATCGASTIDGCECEDRTYVNPARKNHHPTVKPSELMQYLCVLVTPENGIVLDPFMGSGSTGIAAVTADFNFIGIEMSEEYVEIASRRIAYVLTNEFDI